MNEKERLEDELAEQQAEDLFRNLLKEGVIQSPYEVFDLNISIWIFRIVKDLTAELGAKVIVDIKTIDEIKEDLEKKRG